MVFSLVLLLLLVLPNFNLSRLGLGGKLIEIVVFLFGVLCLVCVRLWLVLCLFGFTVC